MKANSIADECHDPQMGALIGEGWNAPIRKAASARSADRGARLDKVVVERIIPRLALIHQEWRGPSAVEPPRREDIEEFGQIVIGVDPSGAQDFFERMRERGLTVDTLFETLLAPTARRLGELWFEDLCDFLDVAVGINRLRILLEMYSNVPSSVGDSHRSAVLISTPDEQHLFGLDMVASFLRASGWDVLMEIQRTAEENARTVAASWFAVVGVTISKEDYLPNAARAIEAVRRASLNPAISIMVGGWALRGRPDLVARVGGDAIAEDGPGAALLAHRLYVGQATDMRRRA